ncbi:MarR family winged helix-turn-helix transcriptional regulator [Alkalicoccus luteus]|uniref:MarR family transcriptional regulator n=1 Tax=Alkalicoccus luteus TaxID=1237094 RepID=A0A969TU83_9BACI|nr:MarR family transcriptional regulator [Alkalicoccus luteus]NJP36711.1 MarR family transcriptional regulator [Alkalicoccus luteus]
MNETKLHQLIEEYANVYLFATTRLDRELVNQAMPLSLEQFGILRVLHEKGPMTAKQVAAETDVHKSAVTAKVARLEERNFVTRTVQSSDRRSVLIALTPVGEEALSEGMKTIIAFTAPYFSKLDEHELEVFLRVYSKLNRMLKEELS